MAIPVSKSIKTFLEELKNRIELLSGSKVTENIDNCKINEINSILSHYDISDEREMNSHDLMMLPKNEIKKLLTYVGQTPDSIDYMMNRLDEYYESIANIINKYITDFISIGTSQAQMFNEKINLYQKYINLFEQQIFKEPFNEINELSRVMAEVGLPDEDKWKILAYIAEQNNATIGDTDINLGSQINEEMDKIEYYLRDEEVNKILKARLETEEVDIDTIPTIASSLKEATGLPLEVLINIISVLISSNLFHQFEISGNKEDKQELKELINSVLSHLTEVKNPAVYEAEKIKGEKFEFYYNSINNGIDETMIKEYMDKPLSEIEGVDISREYAIDLKELSVLKAIFETLETASSKKDDSPEYQKIINVLKKLNEQYRILEDKKESREKIIRSWIRMDEGKKLLSLIIEDKLAKLAKLNEEDLYIDNTNIKELLESITKDINNFYIVTDEIINKVIEIFPIKNEDTFRLNVRSARDLLIGKKEYNLNVKLTQEHLEAINLLKKCLDNRIKSLNPEIINKDENLKRLTELKKQVVGNLLINDFVMVEEITRDYDKANFDKNMLIIMKYINDLNINLMRSKKKNAPIFDIQMIRRPKMDPIIKEILKKLDIKTKEIPNFLLSELKKADALEIQNTYKTIKKNKAENGGILHFIEKDNIVGRIAMLLYATSDSILEVINSLKDENEVVNIPALKLIVNKIPTVFMIKNNTYYKPKYDDYISNYSLLKSINVNYLALVKRNPLFMTIDKSVLDYTLDYLSKVGADKKDIVNRCYKTLSLNPSLLIDNVEIMVKMGINLEDFFAKSNTNYNLLKMSSLEHKLKVIKTISNVEIKDLELLNKLIITKVYTESKNGYINWGDKKW